MKLTLDIDVENSERFSQDMVLACFDPQRPSFKT
jgi:hypothetical protein